MVPGAPTCVRVLHMSDTHGRLVPEMVPYLPQCDILVHSGDFTDNGTAEEYARFDAFLAAAHRFPERVVIFGNHDIKTFHDDVAKMRSLLPHATHVPVHEIVKLRSGIRIYGLPWCGHRYDWSVNPVAPGRCRIHEMPTSGFDILLSHAPAYGTLDELRVGTHCGSTALKQARDRWLVGRKTPSLHLFGHCHEQNGISFDGNVNAVNSAMRPRREPSGLEQPAHVIQFEQRSTGWKTSCVSWCLPR